MTHKENPGAPASASGVECVPLTGGAHFSPILIDPRVQRLVGIYGVAHSLAPVIAALAWNGVLA